MAKPGINITFEIEPIVKLTCKNQHCANNNMGKCNLKSLGLDENGVCVAIRPRTTDKK